MELAPLFILPFDQLGKSLRSKVKAMGNRIRSSVSRFPWETLKERPRCYTLRAVSIWFTTSVLVWSYIFSFYFSLPLWPFLAPPLLLSKQRKGQRCLCVCFVLFSPPPPPLFSNPYSWVLWIWRSHKKRNTKLSAITPMHALWNSRWPLS